MIKIEKILCSTDLSEESDRAFRYANALARAFDAELLVCHCADEVLDFVERRSLERKLVNSLQAQAGAVQCPSIECKPIITAGNPADEIVRLAADNQVDLIVMNSRRKSAVTAFLGSTTEAVIRAAPCPVLVIHPDEREWVGKTVCEIDLERILVAHDFSSDSDLALKYGLALAQEFQTAVHLLYVLPAAIKPAITAPPSAIETDFLQATRLLQKAVPEEAYLWCRIDQAVRAGQPAPEILAYSDEHQIDLICMGVRGTGFVERALFGSTVDRVLRQAKCPLLIVRPVARQDRRQAV